MVHGASFDTIEQQARNSPENVSYSDMLKLCTLLWRTEVRFRKPQRNIQNALGGDPRINLQNKNGKAKPYQVKQAIAAIDRSKEK
jgi:hypothetical protein